MDPVTNFAKPSSAPSDVLREIFSYLQPGDLLRLCGVCRHFRIISLVVLFTTHRSHFHPYGESLSFSSSAAGDLAANIFAVRKVTCRSNKASIDLAVILASLLRMLDLEELEVQFRPATDENKRGLVRYLTGPFVQRQRRPSPPALLMISKCEIKIVERQCPLTWDWRLFVPRLRLPFSLGPALQVLRPPLALLRGAMGSGGWEARLAKDIDDMRKTNKYTTMYLKAVPSPSSTASWSILILDVESIRALTIGHLIPPEKWGFLLPHIHLPTLEQLAICKDARLPVSVLLKFCARHPNIRLISFEHYSLSFDVEPVVGESHLPNLGALEAPLHYFDYILPFIDAARLREVSIGKHPYNKVRGQRSRPAHRILQDRLEKQFDFNKLDVILHKLSQSPICNLALVIPGGSKSKAWLKRCGKKGRAGPSLPQVQTMLVRSEFDAPFTQGVASLFHNLRALCPAITKFRCRRVNAPRGVRLFPEPVEQEIGYVNAINDQPEVVDAFANIRCAACGHFER